MASTQKTSTEVSQEDVYLSREIPPEELARDVTGTDWVERGKNACQKLEQSGDISGDDEVLKLVRVVIRSRRLLLINRVMSQVSRYLSQAGKHAFTEIVARENDAQLVFSVFRHAGDDLHDSLWTLIEVLQARDSDREALSILHYASEARLSEEQIQALKAILQE